MRLPVARWVAAVILLLPIGAAAQDSRAFLALSVNGVGRDDTLVVLRGDDILIAVAALESAGVRGFAGTRETIGDAAFVSLASLAPRVTFQLDEVALTLSIRTDTELLGVSVRDFATRAPADIVYRSAPSGFLNYSLTAGSDKTHTLFAEAGMSAGGVLFHTTASRTSRSAVRGLTSVTIDRRPARQRWVIGDSYATGGALGGDALLAGVSVGSEFSLDPYFVKHPALSMSMPVSMPSVLEVHVNGRLVREEPVQPGRIDVRNLPISTGHNDTRLVLRDPFGATRELASDFYLTSSALARGIHDYRYSFGWLRESASSESWSYKAPVAIGRHRLGLSDDVTGGVRAEVTPGLVSAGPELNLRLPAGEVEVAASVSHAAQGLGTAAQASYVYTGRRLSAGGTLAYMGDQYVNVSMVGASARPVRSMSAFAGLPVGPMSLSLQHSHSTSSDGARDRRTSLLASARLFEQVQIVGNLTRSRGTVRRDLAASVGLTFSLGGRTTSSVSVERSAEGTHAVADLQRSLPVKGGYGYQLRTEAGRRGASSAVVQYQNNYGRYEVRQQTLGTAGRTSVNVSGGLVAIGGGVHASRAVRESFVLVRVPDVEGVRAFSSNQEVGRTDGGGDLLIPGLLPYYGNRLAISDADVPLDYTLSSVQLTLAPPYRGGAVALFPVQRIQRIVGTLRLADAAGERAAAYGSMRLTGAAAAESPLGAKGEFYFENVAPGSYAATATDGDAVCRFAVDIPNVDGAEVNLGVVTCRREDPR